MTDEGVLDPWVSEWLEANPFMATPFDSLSDEILELARGPVGAPPTRDIDQITDDVIDGIPIRIYRNDGQATGLIVYFHGGGFVLGSIGLMDNVARELAHYTGAVVVSVGYRLAPEHPFPAGLDDCETVTRWALAHASGFGVSPSLVAVAGESAGGNLSATVALRLRESGDTVLAGQVLLYPGVDGEATDFPSKEQFQGLILSKAAMKWYWDSYCGGRDLKDDQFAAPLHAESLAGLPPALVVLAGCDPLRDEGRAYAARLRDSGVEVEEKCYAGQPHGFINFGFPSAELAFELVGEWTRALFARIGAAA